MIVVLPCLLDAGYLMPIIKANPHIVESIYFTKDGKHSPIIVGGIVMNDDPRLILSR
jgi:hypothetical protein